MSEEDCSNLSVQEDFPSLRTRLMTRFQSWNMQVVFVIVNELISLWFLIGINLCFVCFRQWNTVLRSGESSGEAEAVSRIYWNVVVFLNKFKKGKTKRFYSMNTVYRPLVLGHQGPFLLPSLLPQTTFWSSGMLLLCFALFLDFYLIIIIVVFLPWRNWVFKMFQNLTISAA